MVTTGKTGTAKDPIFIQDHGAPALYVDLVTELEVDEHDIVRVSFAAISTNGDGMTKAVVAVRLRMSQDFCWQFCRELRALDK